jgi:hypothetical protein
MNSLMVQLFAMSILLHSVLSFNLRHQLKEKIRPFRQFSSRFEDSWGRRHRESKSGSRSTSPPSSDQLRDVEEIPSSGTQPRHASFPAWKSDDQTSVSKAQYPARSDLIPEWRNDFRRPKDYPRSSKNPIVREFLRSPSDARKFQTPSQWGRMNRRSDVPGESSYDRGYGKVESPAYGYYDGDHIYGISPVHMALLAKKRNFEELLVQTGLDASNKKDQPGAKAILDLCEECKIPTREFSKHDLNMLTDSRPHQGFVLRATIREFLPITKLEQNADFK